jgi:parallel beta-helix repeat protein
MAKKKKSWKERQRERLIRMQRAKESYEIQKERERAKAPKTRHRLKWMLGALCIIVLIACVFGIGQYMNSVSTPKENPSQETGENTENESGIAYTFIYINSNGTVSPSTAPIVKEGTARYKFTLDVYGAIFVEKDNIEIDGAGHTLLGKGEDVGIYIYLKNNITIKNLKITGFQYGIFLNSASQNVILKNEISSNYYGVWLTNSSNNNNVVENNVTGNQLGIYLDLSQSNTISSNLIAGNNKGISLYEASKNIITGNTFSENSSGITLGESDNNQIFHNNFMYNIIQAYAENSTNSWDDGVSFGNYWYDYQAKYPEAEEVDNSGIWNIPYEISDGNQDRYPRVKPFTP